MLEQQLDFIMDLDRLKAVQRRSRVKADGNRFENCRNNGSWAEHGVSKAQVVKRNEYLNGLAPELWDYALEQIDLAVASGWLKA